MNGTEIPLKQNNGKDEIIRLVTFNVNGVRTLFHYLPFSQMRDSLVQAFDYFKTDIISFQELKIEKMAINKWGKVDGFYSFITVPQRKKGYSGVGCWVRQYPKGHPLHNALKVVKAEEGMTGFLRVKMNGENIRYRDDPLLGIGGYDGIDTEEENEYLEFDSQGRCVIVELACNLVVFSTYCPANSTRTEEGEIYRMKFLRILFKRIRNLENMGKNVILMGDLNVCRDLIDSAELLEDLSIRLTSETKGTTIDKNHERETQQFVLNPDTPHRRLLNQLLKDSIVEDLAREGILLDSTRLIQGRDRLKIYSVWNTQKNTRPSNYGSRVDFILIDDKIKENIIDSNILPNVMGSDHCPLYTDLAISDQMLTHVSNNEIKIPRFETRYRYNLMNHNIMSMLSRSSTKDSSPIPKVQQERLTSPEKKRPARNTSAIDSFFKKSKTSSALNVTQQIDAEGEKSEDIPKFDSSLADNVIEQNMKPRKPSKQIVFSIKDAFGEAPACKHNEPAVLKTSKTTLNPGKRFWACRRPRGSSSDKESSCGFFQWV